MLLYVYVCMDSYTIYNLLNQRNINDYAPPTYALCSHNHRILKNACPCGFAQLLSEAFGNSYMLYQKLPWGSSECSQGWSDAPSCYQMLSCVGPHKSLNLKRVSDAPWREHTKAPL